MKAEPDSTKADGSVSPQADLEEEQRAAQIMRRIELGDTSVTSEVMWMQLIEPFRKTNK